MSILTLDRSVDDAAVDGSANSTARVAAILLTSGVLELNVGFVTAAPWLVLGLVFELLERVAAREVRQGKEGSQLNRLSYLAAVAAMTITWTAAPSILWLTGSKALQIVAIAILAGQLIHAQAFEFRSRPVLIIGAGIPSIAFFILPTLLGGFHGVAQATVAFSLLTAIGYVALSAKANNRSHAELLRANQAKSAFLAMISHELRTPLNGILGMAQALKLSGLNPRQQEFTQTLIGCGDDLLVLLNDVLDLSKIEAGKMDLDLRPFDIRQLATGVLELWLPTAEKKGIHIALDVAAGVPALLIGDKLRIKQVLLNLISNALKFTADGKVCLSVRTVDVGDNVVSVEIEVRDTGVGMSLAQQERLFQDYVQAEVSTSGSYGGTGLGLSICRRLCKLMSGDISVTSVISKGSTFLVRLPLPVATANSAVDQEDTGAPDLAGCRILVVDDNPNNRAVAQAILGTVGASIETAQSAVEALDILRWGAFDFVLTDLHMPDMDGRELARRIRRGEAGASDIGIVALTGDTHFVSADFDAIHSKPIQISELLKSLCRLRQVSPPSIQSAARAR